MDVVIRRAQPTRKDLDALVCAGELAERDTQNNAHFGVKLDTARGRGNCRRLLFGDRFFAFIAEAGGEPVGVFFGSAGPWIFGDGGSLIGEEIWFWVRKDFRVRGVGQRLLDAFEEECRKRGCSITVLTTMEWAGNWKAYARLYGRRGYKPMNYRFSKILNEGA